MTYNVFGGTLNLAYLQLQVSATAMNICSFLRCVSMWEPMTFFLVTVINADCFSPSYRRKIYFYVGLTGSWSCVFFVTVDPISVFWPDIARGN